MLRISAITVEDFAPFKGRQVITLPVASGVTVITANNGLGKTWLLNAIRFALFGHVLGRTDVSQDLKRVANWETSKETGRTAFCVVLELEQDGTRYRLTRSFDAGRRPADEVLLGRGEVVLNQEDTRRELERLLPEQIARFFLFDGELLRQYEELAVDPTRGEDLKAAIERILGLPILTNARSDVLAAGARITRALSQAASNHAQTEQLGRSLRLAQDRFDELQREFGELSLAVDQLEHQRAALEEQLGRTERIQKVFAKREAFRDQLRRADSAREVAEADLREKLAELWREMLSSDLDAAVRGCDERIAELSQMQVKDTQRRQRALDRQRAIKDGVCPTCGRVVRLGELPDEHEEAEDDRLLEDASQELEELLLQKGKLARLQPARGAVPIAVLERSVDSLRVEVADLQAEIESLERALDGTSEAELKQLATDYANVRATLDRTRRRRDEADAGSKEQAKAIQQLVERLSKLSGADAGRLQAKANAIGELTDLFDEAIDHYRDRLSRKVEAEATAIFRRLRSEQDYERLAINAGYGLTIVHQDGEQIPVRSAGYEHLVALSLLAALQRCAPIKGPVILDSPFGRLDPEHKARVVAALPSIADQVILLAYENEFDRDAAASALGPKLVAEKRLRRITARHTEIVDRS